MHRWLVLLVALATAAPALASPQAAVAAARADAQKLPPEQAKQTRYLSLHSVPVDYRAEVVKVLAFHTNQKSRESTLAAPRPLTADALVLAVELDRYGWKRETWEQTRKHAPHFLEQEYWPGGKWTNGHSYPAGYYQTRQPRPEWAKEWAALVLLTGSESPVVDGPWLFVQGCRQISLNGRDDTGLGYYDWLGFKSRADFDKLIAFDRKKSLEIGREQKAVLERSGVAQQVRAIEIHQALTGRRYATLDSDSSVDEDNAIDNLGKARHKAEELYGVNRNGLYVFLLCDDKGKLQAEAPSFIGGDDSPLRRGRRVAIDVCRSCVNCHINGLQPVDDYVRRTFQPPLFLNVADRKVFLETQRQYFTDLTAGIQEDNARYAKVLLELNGFKPAENARAFARLYDWYVERGRTTADIALEIGVPEKQFLEALRQHAERKPLVPLSIAPLLREKGSVRVELHERLLPVYYQIMRNAK